MLKSAPSCARNAARSFATREALLSACSYFVNASGLNVPPSLASMPFLATSLVAAICRSNLLIFAIASCVSALTRT